MVLRVVFHVPLDPRIVFFLYFLIKESLFSISFPRDESYGNCA
jgi:hypothetical protein